MKGFIGSLGRNKGLKFLSLLLAVALWAAVGIEEPTETTLSMALELANPPQHMMITSEIPSSIQVRVHGPGGVIRRLTQSRLVQTIDLSGFKKGVHTIPLGPKNFNFPRGVQVTRVQPNPLVLTLASAMIRTLQVHPVLEGKPPKGYEITGVRARPSQVKVKGPTSEISDLKYLPTLPLDVSQLTVGATLAAEFNIKNMHLDIQDQAPVLVDVEVAPKKISRTISGVEVTATPQKARLHPSRVRITLKGPMLELRNLKPTEIKAVVDTSNLPPGRHRLDVSVNLPSSLELVRIRPATITAHVEKSP